MICDTFLFIWRSNMLTPYNRWHRPYLGRTASWFIYMKYHFFVLFNWEHHLNYVLITCTCPRLSIEWQTDSYMHLAMHRGHHFVLPRQHRQFTSIDEGSFTNDKTQWSQLFKSGILVSRIWTYLTNTIFPSRYCAWPVEYNTCRRLLTTDIIQYTLMRFGKKTILRYCNKPLCFLWDPLKPDDLLPRSAGRVHFVGDITGDHTDNLAVSGIASWLYIIGLLAWWNTIFDSFVTEVVGMTCFKR